MIQTTTKSTILKAHLWMKNHHHDLLQVQRLVKKGLETSLHLVRTNLQVRRLQRLQ